MYLQSLSSTLDQTQDGFNGNQNSSGARQGQKGVGQHGQNRRLMDTSNMFTVYRNSLKNNLNNNSNGFVEQ